MHDHFNPYEALEFSQTTSQDKILEAFPDLNKKCQLDRNMGGSEFKQRAAT
jgi:preprotein translocase subunit Sec63